MESDHNSQAWIYKTKISQTQIDLFPFTTLMNNTQESEDLLIANENIQNIVTYLHDGNINCTLKASDDSVWKILNDLIT